MKDILGSYLPLTTFLSDGSTDNKGHGCSAR